MKAHPVLPPSSRPRGRPLPRSAAVWITVLIVVSLISLAAASGGEKQRARDLEAQGDLTGAVEVYRHLLGRSPDDVVVLRALALDLLLLQRYDDALSVQERIVALDPKDALTRVELAFNYLNHQERAADAVTYLTQACALEPSAKYLTFLAQAQMETGDVVGAEQNLRRGLATDPSYPHAYGVLLRLLGQEGRTQEAQALRQEAEAQGVALPH